MAKTNQVNPTRACEHQSHPVPMQTFCISRYWVKLTFRADNLLGVLLQLEGHVADSDLSHGEVRPVHLALLAQLRQQLHGLHGVPPLIVAASEKKLGPHGSDLHKSNSLKLNDNERMRHLLL